MFKRTLASLAIAGLAASCSASNDENGDAAATRVSAQALIVNGEDVTGMEYDLQKVDCDGGAPIGSSIVVVRELEDQVIPGELTEFADTPLEADSEHSFSDLFQVVDAGCYNITTTPLNSDGEPSTECFAAIKTGVEVLEGETTEVFMINQCRGTDPGALDAVSALNREPSLDDVWFTDSKFFCGSEGEICAAASDPDGDSLEFELTLEEDAPCTVEAGDPDDGEQCWTIVCSESGQVNFNISVYDQLVSEGESMRIEDWLEAEGYASESHAELNAFAYIDVITMYLDEDGDGYGSEEAEFCSGEDTTGYVDDGGDCNDEDADVNPGAEEICEDGIDNDCDGEDAICPCVDPDTKMDIVLLQDLSGSFYDDIDNVRALVAPLYAAVNDCVAEANFGVASFIDKPFAPFGVAGDYSYQPVSDLSSDLSTLQSAVDGLVLGNGYDYSESQMTGILHTANDGYFSWAEDTEKFIILLTDAQNHVAGDCDLASCPEGPNNGDAIMSEYEDYPSYTQVGAAVNDLGANVVFATTADVTGYYAGVQASLGVDGNVVTLSSDSSNLVDAVLTGIECQCED